MGNVENPEQEQPAPTEAKTEPDFVDEVGNWVKSIFEPTAEAQPDASTEPTSPSNPNTSPNPSTTSTSPTTAPTTKSTTTLAPSLQKSASKKETTATVSHANTTANNTAKKAPEPLASVVDPTLYGQITIRVTKGSRFPKSDPTSLEIGFANEDGSWVVSESDRQAKEREANPIQHSNGVMSVTRRPLHQANPLKSERAKAGESPVFHNCALQGAWHKGEHVRIAVYAKGMAKDKLLGVAKLDYSFFRSWYISGKRTEERRVGLEYEKKNKDKEYGIYLTVNYEGVSLAPEKEVMGMTLADMKLSAKSTMNQVNNDLKSVGKDFASTMQKEFTREIGEPEKKENALEKVERKVSNINPFNRLNPF